VKYEFDVSFSLSLSFSNEHATKHEGFLIIFLAARITRSVVLKGGLLSKHLGVLAGEDATA
jgi:hypothetical protein